MRTLLLSIALLLGGSAAALALDIILPTANDALFRDRPEEFYMYVNRWEGGVKSTPWEGGQYGFVRDPRNTPQGVIYTRFHYGIDIKPLERDAPGNPLDPVKAIAAGKVVHVSPEARASNFGKYLVIEHQWDGCPYYSLYAHLSEIHVQPGTEVAQGDTVARMGFTGRGLDRERAHLHLEVALMMNANFDAFYGANYQPPQNRHGNFNGINLRGMDVARLYREARSNPKLTIPEFLAREEAAFTVSIPGTYTIDLSKRYPWMERTDPAIGSNPPASWQIAFSAAGVPLRVKKSGTPVTGMTVAMAKSTELPLTQVTRGIVTGTMASAALSSRGKQLIDLLTRTPDQSIAGSAPSPIPGKTHTIKKGETLIVISRQHKIPVKELQTANNITDPAKIQIGQVLVIPGGEEGGDPAE